MSDIAGVFLTALLLTEYSPVNVVDVTSVPFLIGLALIDFEISVKGLAMFFSQLKGYYFKYTLLGF
jgi:hypothetical protein